jgi:CsoR family transcriptional regulator, copper-sensing transcriptional repressor
MSDSLIAALNRIEGQVRGIRKMYQEGRDCEQIIQQISAIQSAMRRVGKEILSAEATMCVGGEEQKKKLSVIVENLLKIS